MKPKQTKRDRKFSRKLRRNHFDADYRKRCRETIDAARKRKATAEELRGELKAARHDFSRLVAGRKAAAA